MFIHRSDFLQLDLKKKFMIAGSIIKYQIPKSPYVAMSNSPREKILAQAKERGLILSPDGKSWVPIKELIVREGVQLPNQLVIREKKSNVTNNIIHLGNSITMNHFKLLILTPLGIYFVVYGLLLVNSEFFFLGEIIDFPLNPFACLPFFMGIYLLMPFFSAIISENESINTQSLESNTISGQIVAKKNTALPTKIAKRFLKASILISFLFYILVTILGLAMIFLLVARGSGGAWG